MKKYNSAIGLSLSWHSEGEASTYLYYFYPKEDCEVEKGIYIFPTWSPVFSYVFFVNFRLLGRLSGVDVNFLLCLSVAVVCSWLTVVGYWLLIVLAVVPFNPCRCPSLHLGSCYQRVGKLPAMRIRWNCQKLASEQLLLGQPVQTSITVHITAAGHFFSS
jgi:hypothetical protein